jgi:hypothetical protein
VLGDIDLASLSLPALTLILAGLDAFNPCAFFVLLFLLSMMAHQKSRTRMLATAASSCWFPASCTSPSWPPGSTSSSCLAISPG